jgi:hypothetical protein
MAAIPVGSDVSAGTYKCVNCGYEMGVQSVVSLPPCPKCDGPYSWKALTGGDSKEGPVPGVVPPLSKTACFGAGPVGRRRAAASEAR